MPRLDHAQLGDRDLEVGEDLEQHRLELLVGLVDLVDQQDDRVLGADRLEQGRVEEELLAEDVAPGRLPGPLALAARLGLDPEQLLAVVPLIEGLRLIEALVALQAHQPTVVGARDRLGELGLPDAGRALDENGLAQPLGEEGDQRGGLVGQIAHLAETLADLGDRLGLGLRHLGDDRYRLMVALALPDSLGPYAVLLAIGFVVGWYGHGARSNWIIAFGIVLILASIGLLQLAIATHNGRAPTGF